MDDALRRGTLRIQIIVGVITAGLALTAVVFYVLADRIEAGDLLAEHSRLVLGVVVGFGVLEMLAYYAVRAVILKRARKLTASGAREESALSLVPLLGVLTIIAAALVEGFGVLGLVAYLLTGDRMVLVVPAVAFVWLLFLFPTVDGMERRIARLFEPA